jgi:acyl carrier protein
MDFAAHTIDPAVPKIADGVSSAVPHQVLRLLGYILSRPLADLENPSRSSEPAWDSLKHIELVFLLEDHFGLRFSEQEMSTMHDAAGIARIVERAMEKKGAP